MIVQLILNINGTGWFKKHHAYKVADSKIYLYGEDIFGVHSITYDPVPENKTFYAFALSDMEFYYSYEDLCDYVDELNIPLVPIDFRGKIKSLNELKELHDEIMSSPSHIGKTREGLVIRVADKFKVNTHCINVAKSVRKNHVQTDKHWTKNWKKCRLC